MLHNNLEYGLGTVNSSLPKMEFVLDPILIHKQDYHRDQQISST